MESTAKCDLEVISTKIRQNCIKEIPQSLKVYFSSLEGECGNQALAFGCLYYNELVSRFYYYDNDKK